MFIHKSVAVTKSATWANRKFSDGVIIPQQVCGTCLQPRYQNPLYACLDCGTFKHVRCVCACQRWG